MHLIKSAIQSEKTHEIEPHRIRNTVTDTKNADRQVQQHIRQTWRENGENGKQVITHRKVPKMEQRIESTS